MMEPYIHGTSDREQERLIRQADTLSKVLLAGLDLRSGERVLEVGCGVGAVLEQVHRAEPGLLLTGVDVSARQISSARHHLGTLGVQANLLEADAYALPFADESFDRVMMVWVLEHLSDPSRALGEARRVLRPGGRIDLTETDYGVMRVSPRDEAVDAFLAAFVRRFASAGNPHSGPQLGSLLERAGFVHVDSIMHGIHFWCPSRAKQIASLTSYLLDFIRPEMKPMTQSMTAHERAQVELGLSRFESLDSRDDSSLSATIWRAVGWK